MGQDGPCFNRDSAFRFAFTEASIAAGGDVFYPNTLVWHILAGADEVGALGQELTYYEAMLRAGPMCVSTCCPGCRTI